MSQCESEAEGLRVRGAHGRSAGREQLEEEISHLQGNVRCVRRAAGLMAFLTAFFVAGIAYPSILLENFPSNAPTLIMDITYALGAGSLVSLLAFAALGIVYRRKLRQRREACRQMAASPMDPSPGQANTTCV